MKMYVEKAKSKNGNDYFVLKVDLGYREIPVSFDANVCAELLGVSLRELYEIEDKKEIK